MKFTITALASVLSCCAQLAAAATGNVYTYDPSTSASQRMESRSLSPATARLVLAQRAGVEDYHIEKTLSEEEIVAINDYGSKKPLFGQKDRIRRAFILGLSKDVGSEVISKHASSSFAISPAPAAGATEGLFYNLAEQADPSTANAKGNVVNANDDLYITASSLEDVELHFLRLLEKGTWAITALMMPSHDYARTGSGSYQWGTYSMPNSQSMLQKRESPAEEPLSSPVTHISPNLPGAMASNKTGPLPGILPACFPSLSSCQSSTRNCTGHGSCRKLYTDPDAASGKDGDCFACACSATKSEFDGKVKTTYWAGPACQKQDVSTQFWIIALFTVGLVFVVSFAVGSVWSMGSEELPSVIGAGVSGPVRK